MNLSARSKTSWMVLSFSGIKSEIPPEITYKNVLYSRKYSTGVLEPNGILISLLEYKNFKG